MAPFRWGILGTGVMARKFALGLRASESGRVAAIGSRTPSKAASLARSVGASRHYGSYEGVAADPDVDAIYVATPPSVHRDHALLSISAGRPVLIEKPFALDADQAREVRDAAEAASVFCMEGMWTRFLPLVRRAKVAVDAGELGKVRIIRGSFGKADVLQPGNSLFDPAMGGGALLDRGVYPLSLACHLLGPPRTIVSQSIIGETGVDEQMAAVLRYESGALGVVEASLRTRASNDLVIIGDKGELHVASPIFRPSRMTLTFVRERPSSRDRIGRLDAIAESHFVHVAVQSLGGLTPSLPRRSGRRIVARYAGNGYHYEADEVMRRVRSGSTESPLMPLSETVAVMEAMDTIRDQRMETGP